MAKSGFIEVDGVLQIWADDEHIANLTSEGFAMVGSKEMKAGTLKGSGGNAVWHAGNLAGTKASKINDVAGGQTVDTNARAKIATIIDALEAFGVSAT